VNAVVWALLGFLVGFAVGSAATWLLLRRPARALQVVSAIPPESPAIPLAPLEAAPAPMPTQLEFDPAGSERDGIEEAIATNRAVLADLEQRYQRRRNAEASKRPGQA
jgi:hypothetical protein